MKLRKSIAFLLSMILILVSAMPVQALDAPVLIPTDERSKSGGTGSCSGGQQCACSGNCLAGCRDSGPGRAR